MTFRVGFSCLGVFPITDLFSPYLTTFRKCTGPFYLWSLSGGFVCTLDHSGVVVQHADSQHKGCEFESYMRHSKNAFGEEATENHLIRLTSYKKLRALSLVSATLEMEYAKHH